MCKTVTCATYQSSQGKLSAQWSPPVPQPTRPVWVSIQVVVGVCTGRLQEGAQEAEKQT